MTYSKIKLAVKWHLENVWIYKKTGNIRMTRKQAIAEVIWRFKNKCNLTGFNCTPQEKWTY